MFKKLVLLALALLPGSGFFFSAQSKQIPFTEAYFPDAVVRQWLTTVFPGAIADGMIETDKVTKVTELFKDYASNPYNDVEDLRCLRYFTNLNSGKTFSIVIPYSNFKKLKYIDVSGLTNLTSISNGIKNTTSGTKTNSLMTAPLQEVIADGCTGLTEFNINNCVTLERVSVKDCTALTTFICGCNDYAVTTKEVTNTKLQSIDLSDSPNIATVNVPYNSNLNVLKLAPSGRVFPLNNSGQPYSPSDLYVYCQYCQIEDLDLRNVYTLSNGTKKFSLNCRNNKIREIKFATAESKLTFSSCIVADNQLLSLGIPYVAGELSYTVTTAQSGTQKRLVGPSSVVRISDDEEYVEKGTFASVKSLNVQKTAPAQLSFTSTSATSGSYTYTPYGDATNSAKLKMTVTVTRKNAMQMWLCGDFNGWDLTTLTAPDNWESIKDDWELVYDADADADIYQHKHTGDVSGNYMFKVYDPNQTDADDQEYWLGGSYSDVVTPYNALRIDEMPDAAAYADDETDPRYWNIYDVNSEAQTTYDNFVYAAYVQNESSPIYVIKNSPYPFTTHHCQSNGRKEVRHDPVFTVAYVSGHTTGTIANVGGTTTGVTTPAVEADANAPEVWYNLQGINVEADNQVPGIYIVRKGNQTHKVIVK